VFCFDGYILINSTGCFTCVQFIYPCPTPWRHICVWIVLSLADCGGVAIHHKNGFAKFNVSRRFLTYSAFLLFWFNSQNFPHCVGAFSHPSWGIRVRSACQGLCFVIWLVGSLEFIATWNQITLSGSVDKILVYW